MNNTTTHPVEPGRPQSGQHDHAPGHGDGPRPHTAIPAVPGTTENEMSAATVDVIDEWLHDLVPVQHRARTGDRASA